MGISRADALAEGTMVGGYRIAHRLGGGGMGTVYAAEEPTIKKRVAIKVLRHALADDAAVAARFEREARAANDVRHPAIVDVFAFGKLDDGRPYLVMSLLEGRSLREEIHARRRIPAAEAWAWAREIAEALAAAHEAGIVHRDLKPDNVFLERYGERPARPRLLDLGLVKLTREDEEDAAPMKLTATGVPMGTPAYMAPEQWWGSDVDGRVDQYALGVTLFEMLAGDPPFRSQQFMELAQQHASAVPPTLASSGAPVPEAVEALVARALAKSPDDRFPSMTALIEAGDSAFAAGAAGAERDAIAHAETVALPGGSGAASAAIPLRKPAAAVAAVSPPGIVEASAPAASGDAARAGRFLWIHVLTVIAGAAAIVAIGYAGAERRDLKEWSAGGWPVQGSLVAFVAGAILVAWTGARRARTGARSLAPWGVALLTAAIGALGTYLGWDRSASAIAKIQAPTRFEILHRGIFEVELSRFIAFHAGAVLFVSIAAAAGASSRSGEAAAPAIGRGASIAATLGLLALAVIGAAIGAPSASFVAATAAALVALDLALPPIDRRTIAADAMERALAGLVALGLALAVGLVRAEARRSVVWSELPTRAARAVELVAAAREQRWLVVIGVASIAAFAGVEIVRLRNISKGAPIARPSGALLVALGIAAAIGAGGAAQHALFSTMRGQLHAELDSQFSLFARLDPPAAGGLDRKKHAPHPAPALQIARNVVAVNARAVAPLSAIESPDGAANLGRDLSHALAEHAARSVDLPIDLAVMIDRTVPWGTVARLLGVAARSGARKIEVLLTLGSPEALPAGAPPEGSWVLSGDFAAIAVELADDGLRAGDAEPFGDVAPRLVRRALDGGGAVRVAPR